MLGATLAARGVECQIAPVFEIVETGAPVPLEGVQAVLATSANGARALAGATARREIPVFAVGDATAEALRAAGFAAVESARGASGDLAGLVRARLDPAGGTLVHVCGREVAGDLVGALLGLGFKVERAVLYEARPLAALDPETVRAVVTQMLGGAMFFSPRAASTFVRLARAAGIVPDLKRMIAWCLSEQVAVAARAVEWQAIAVAARPELSALVDLVVAETRKR
ncbi:MAG: uroporphyrinogen-III synthase [Alphaproteobacteria bacterium]